MSLLNDFQVHLTRLNLVPMTNLCLCFSASRAGRSARGTLLGSPVHNFFWMRILTPSLTSLVSQLMLLCVSFLGSWVTRSGSQTCSFTSTDLQSLPTLSLKSGWNPRASSPSTNQTKLPLPSIKLPTSSWSACTSSLSGRKNQVLVKTAGLRTRCLALTRWVNKGMLLMQVLVMAKLL